MKKQNEGVRAYQEEQRQETLSKIDEAYRYLKDTHQTVTKTAISKESGVSKKTLTKPYVYEHLMRYPEFAGTEIEKSGTSEEMAARIKMLEEQLKISVQRNKKLTEELKKVKAENDIKYKQLRLDYERIAGAYQKLSEKKTGSSINKKSLCKCKQGRFLMLDFSYIYSKLFDIIHGKELTHRKLTSNIAVTTFSMG